MTPNLVGASLLRGTRAADIRNGRVKKAAFLPRANGNDRDGLSVSIRDGVYRDLHRALYVIPGRATAIVASDAVVRIGLVVNSAPEQGDPMHALIVGIPDRTAGDEQKLRAERFAEELANLAREYNHDRGE
jgi:hypothetical protein